MLKVFNEMKEGSQGIFLVSQCDSIIHNLMFDLTKVSLYTKEMEKQGDAFLVRKQVKEGSRGAWIKSSRKLVRLYPEDEPMFFTEGPLFQNDALLFRKRTMVSVVATVGPRTQTTLVAIPDKKDPVPFTVLMVRRPT